MHITCSPHYMQHEFYAHNFAYCRILMDRPNCFPLVGYIFFFYILSTPTVLRLVAVNYSCAGIGAPTDDPNRLTVYVGLVVEEHRHHTSFEAARGLTRLYMQYI